MNKIANILIPILTKDGRFSVKRNSPSMDVYQIAQDSNTWGADIHVAIHSNAGGGVGTEVYAYAPKTNSERLAQALYDQIAPLSPGADRGVKYNPKLIEVGDSVHATAALIELGFHDNQADATWIAYNSQSIANGLYKGICDFYSYDYRALTVATPVIHTDSPNVLEHIKIKINNKIILDKEVTAMEAIKVLAVSLGLKFDSSGSTINVNSEVFFVRQAVAYR